MRIGRIQNDYTAAGFDLVKEQGLSFVEICRNSQAESEHLVANRESVLAEVRRTGIDVSSVGRWNHDVQADGILVPERVKSYHDLLDTAIFLGAKTFVCGINYDESISRYKNYTHAIEFFGALCERARGTGVKVAAQNCYWNNFILRPADWDIVLGELPELWIKYDASHSYNRGDDYLAELSDWGERVAHVHIKGTTHAGSKAVADPPAGMDDIKWRSLFSILYARGYDGDLSIEPHSSVWQGELGAAGVLFTRDFIKQFIVRGWV